MAKTAKSKPQGKSKAHVGNIPMTAAAAKKRGLTASKRKVSPHALSSAQQKKWLLSATTAKGEICGIRPLPGGGVEVCYIDPHTGECNDCHRSD